MLCSNHCAPALASDADLGSTMIVVRSHFDPFLRRVRHQHLSARPRRNAGRKQCRCRAIDRAVAAAALL